MTLNWIRNLVTIVLIVFSKFSYGQLSIDTTSYFIYDSNTNTSTDWSQYLGAADTLPSSTITFDTITFNDFIKYKKRYNPKIDTDSSKITWTDTSFIIQNKSWEKTFNTIASDVYAYNYYKGFLEPLNFFLVLNIDGQNELGILLLIDKITGKQYFLSSGYDDPCESVFLSPNNHYLFSYANNHAENNQCAFTILKIEKTKKHFKPKGFIGLEVNTWTINEMAWINDNSFVMSINEKTNTIDYTDNSSIVHYLKGSFSNK